MYRAHISLSIVVIGAILTAGCDPFLEDSEVQHKVALIIEDAKLDCIIDAKISGVGEGDNQHAYYVLSLGVGGVAEQRILTEILVSKYRGNTWEIADAPKEKLVLTLRDLCQSTTEPV